MEAGDRNGRLRRLVGIEEVAGMLGVGVRHVRRLVADRRIPYLKWGHLLRFDPVEIREWLDAARRPVEPERPVVPGLPLTARRRAAGGRWPAAGSL
jgi:excisionase family DNA binding protein